MLCICFLMVILAISYALVVFGYLIPSIMQLLLSARMYKQDLKPDEDKPNADSVYFHALFNDIIISFGVSNNLAIQLCYIYLTRKNHSIEWFFYLNNANNRLDCICCLLFILLLLLISFL